MSTYEVRVTEGGSVSCLWFYAFQVEADSKEAAEAEAARRVQAGEAEPYDSSTGDPEDTGEIDSCEAYELT